MGRACGIMLLVLPSCGIPPLRHPEPGPGLPADNGPPDAENSAKLAIEEFYTDPVLICLILWWFKLKWEAIAEAFAVIGIGVVGLGIKMFVDRTRPPQDLLNGGVMLDNGKFSFPAGHVESLVAIFGFLMYLSWQLLPERNWVRWLTLFVYGFMLTFIGISRVYLGEHWPLDVVAGYLFGTFWLWLTIRFYEWGKDRYFVHERTRINAER